jgi:hypothetical protein
VRWVGWWELAAREEEFYGVGFEGEGAVRG